VKVIIPREATPPTCRWLSTTLTPASLGHEHAKVAPTALASKPEAEPPLPRQGERGKPRSDADARREASFAKRRMTHIFSDTLFGLRSLRLGIQQALGP